MRSLLQSLVAKEGANFVRNEKSCIMWTIAQRRVMRTLQRIVTSYCVAIRYLLSKSMPLSVIDFWEQVGSADADAERLYEFLIERGSPASSRELALHLIEWRWREEQEQIAQAAALTSATYQPKQTYSVGQRIHFAAFGNREGVVKKTRPGDNPRLGAFQVITVKFDEDPSLREFAMAFVREHPLNQELARSKESLGISLQEITARYGESVQARIVQRLSADKEFVHSGDQWFLKELIPTINPGYLNLAEAAIEQSGDAVRTSDLLKVLDMTDTKGAAATFALNSALATDPRFDNVGPKGDSRWYLTRLEPPEAIEHPPVLLAAHTHIGALAPELETIAAELFDEADLNGNAQTSVIPRDETLAPNARPEVSLGSAGVNLILTYPHRYAGTLPLTPAVRALLPEFSRARFRFSLEDVSSHKKIAGYAVRDGNYIAGFSQWFNAWRISPGAMINLRRGVDPLTVVIDPQLLRERGLWVRVARVAEGRLTFGQERRPLAHKYDEEMLIVVGDPLGIEKLSESPQSKLPLGVLLEEIFPELAKLSSAGRVHAKTLYSAVNFVRRAGPRAVLSALTESHAFTPTGGGYFVLNESKR